MKLKKLTLYASLLGTLLAGANLYKNNKYYNNFIHKIDEHINNDNHDSNIVAHRGFSSLFVENSIEAVINAYDSDCVDEVEVDVRLTKDKQIVLMHNDYLNFNCNTYGKVENKTLEELKSYEYRQSKLLIYNNFSPDKKLIKDRNIENQKNISQILTLEELFKMVNSDKNLIIDVKLDNNKIEMFNELSDLLSKYKGNLNIKIQSTDDDFLQMMKKFYPNYSYQMIIKNKEDLSYISSNYDSLAIKYKLIDEQIVDECIKNNKKIYLWTISNYNEYLYVRKKLKDKMKYVTIVSDNPDVMCCLNNCNDKQLTKIKK